MLRRSMFLRLLRNLRNQVVNRIIYLTAITILRQSLNNSFTRITILLLGHRFIQNRLVDSTIRSLTQSQETKFSILPFKSTRLRKATKARKRQTIQLSPNNPLVETSFNSTKSINLNNLIRTLKKKHPH